MLSNFMQRGSNKTDTAVNNMYQIILRKNGVKGHWGGAGWYTLGR